MIKNHRLQPNKKIISLLLFMNYQYWSYNPFNFYWQPYNIPFNQLSYNFYGNSCEIGRGTILEVKKDSAQPDNWNNELGKSLKNQNIILSQQEEINSSQQYSPKSHAQSQIKQAGEKKLSKASLKKNTQTNIVGGLFTYLATESKSGKLVMKLVEDDVQKYKAFYSFMKNLKKLNKKYLNKETFKQFYRLRQKGIYLRVLKKSTKKLEILPIQQFKKIVRKLSLYYYQQPLSILPILTSNRIQKKTTVLHIQKRRQIIQNLSEFYSLQKKSQ